LLSVQSVAQETVSQKAQRQSVLQVPSLIQTQRTGQIQTPSIDQILTNQIRSDVISGQVITPVQKQVTVSQPVLISTPIVTPISTYYERQTKTPTTKITTDTWYEPTRIPTPITTTIPGGFLPPGGPGPTPFGRKRRYNFMEVFNMGLDIGGPIMTAPRGMKPPKLKRSSLPGGRQKVKVSKKKR
jgi:hypothetical protein